MSLLISQKQDIGTIPRSLSQIWLFVHFQLWACLVGNASANTDRVMTLISKWNKTVRTDNAQTNKSKLSNV